MAPNFGTLDCGRGCPFECTFCTIINVQGRKMRFRSAEHIAEAIRKNYKEHGITFYFFTDDNFARNKNWEQILDVMAKLKNEEKIPLKFMMQVDVLSWKIKNFVEKARIAGCTNVFIGMESVESGKPGGCGKKTEPGGGVLPTNQRVSQTRESARTWDTSSDFRLTVLNRCGATCCT